MKKFNKLLFTILSVLLICSPAWATNGLKLIGSGAASNMMGGVGAVSPRDTGSLLANPAGASKLNSRFDLYTEYNIISLKLDTSSAASGTFRNSVGSHQSEGSFFFIPEIGFIINNKDSNTSYGFVVAGTSGLKADFKQSRINPAVAASNTFDKHLEGATTEFAGILSYRATEKLSIGISPVFTISYIIGNLTNNSFTVTNGHDHHSWALGGGFNLGTIYDLSDTLSFGASFKSMKWQTRYDEYNDTIDRLNMPPEYIVGISYTPNDRLLFETNAKWIHWKAVDILAKEPFEGGFGWDNQWVFGFGSEVKLTEKTKLRFGYNYGQSPIDQDVLFANSISPLISEHHLSFGINYLLNPKWELNVGYLHSFTNSLTDNGEGDTFSQSGAGTSSKLSLYTIIVGMSYIIG